MSKQELFFESCEDGYTETVKDLFNDPDVDSTVYNNSAIRWAAHNGYTEIVKLLLGDPRIKPCE